MGLHCKKALGILPHFLEEKGGFLKRSSILTLYPLWFTQLKGKKIEKLQIVLPMLIIDQQYTPLQNRLLHVKFLILAKYRSLNWKIFGKSYCYSFGNSQVKKSCKNFVVDY